MTEATVVAIDGPAGSGKSTIAAALGRLLGLPVLSTGIFFRIVAWGLLEEAVDADGVDAWFRRHRILVDGSHGWLDDYLLIDELRSERVQARLSHFAADAAVRRNILVLEREQISALGSVVVEGRDIGTVVWPQASSKFYLVARQEVRFKRRPEEGVKLFERDRRDSTRIESPMRIADDAFVLDNSDQTVDALTTRIARLVRLRSQE